MKRKIAIAVAVLTLVLMFFPTFEYGATEMGFEPGGADPNLYQSVVKLGWPLPWVEFVHDRRESDSLDEHRLGSIRPWNVMIYAGFFLVSVWIDPRPWRRK